MSPAALGVAHVLERDRARGARVRGAGRFVGLAAGLVAFAVLSEMLRPALFDFATGPVLPEAVAAVAIRLALVGFVWGALAAYDAVVRPAWRPVLHLHPVDPAAVAVAGLWVERRMMIGVAFALSALAWPLVLAGAPLAFGLVAAVAAGGVASGVAGGAVASLGAVAVTEDPRFAAFLDGVRGSNPRAQAALLYAPGAALAVGGWLLLGAARGVVAVLGGDPTGWMAVGAPYVAATVALGTLPRLAERTWFQASGVLAEIQARYDALERPEEARAAFLDWTVRWLPAAVAPHALRDLRGGWRGHRGYLSAAWLVGLVGAWLAWSDDPTAPATAGAASAAGMWAVASVAVRLRQDDPPFLVWWAGLDGWAPAAGRAWAVGQWLGPCLWLPLGAVLVRAGVDRALGLGAGLVAVSVVAASMATWAAGRGARPAWTYALVAAVGAGLSVRGLWWLETA